MRKAEEDHDQHTKARKVAQPQLGMNVTSCEAMVGVVPARLSLLVVRSHIHGKWIVLT